MKILITTVPFGEKDKSPIKLLEKSNIRYSLNPKNEKLTESELAEIIHDYDALIAGTEKIGKKVLQNAKKLKLISRVGIGLDGVDLHEAKKRNIKVSYTPDAPTLAVSELTICLMLSVLRSVHISNSQMHKGKWLRHFGRRLSEVKIGLIGVGRIGKKVIEHLKGFDVKKIMANDLENNKYYTRELKIDWLDKEEIYKEADIISLHLPLNKLTKDMISGKQLLSMKKNASLINTSRGGIVNEIDLYNVLVSGHLGNVAIDVFDKEPYKGNLQKIERCLLTSHIGSMSVDCRTKMEIQATEEVIRYFDNKELKNQVPDEEYLMQI